MFIPLLLLPLALQVAAAPQDSPPVDQAPVVVLGSAKVSGINNEGGISQSFLGIPFAVAPRFDLPRGLSGSSYVGFINANRYGAACIQHDLITTATEVMREIIEDFHITISAPKHQSEDCLSINVIRPATAIETSQLPVVVWFYGGGFLTGDSETYHSMGRSLVDMSVANKEDVIFVSFNYRLSAYGFLAGSEVQRSRIGNIGLRDQREALRWIQSFITNFGGNPGRVILWGQSAGSISVSLQMLVQNGVTSNLFHGVFAQSGSPPPVGSISNEQTQASFDFLVQRTGCQAELDKLQCLRTVDLNILRDAVNATDGIFSDKTLVLTWTPRADGDFLTDFPYRLIQGGRISPVPLVTGNVDDEGTVFALPVLDYSTSTQFLQWVKEIWVPAITDGELDTLSTQYPDDPSDGSPFDTGDNNILSPEYKRISAFGGDMAFHAPRRNFVQGFSRAGRGRVWVYLSKQFKESQPFGSSHGSDVNVTGSYYLMNEFVAKFANNLNPNLGGRFRPWPLYNNTNPQLYLFPAADGSGSLPDPTIQADDYRGNPIAFLNQLAQKYPL